MSDTTFCPECGSGLSPDAPKGLCPRCLLNAALGATASRELPVDSTEGGPTGTSVLPQDRLTADPASEPSRELSLDAFKRLVVELGIIDAKAIDRHVPGSDLGCSGLVRSLIRSGAMTAYQASAIRQGKARGLLIGRYLILDKLGEGGMGVVFKARHRLLDRVVALKILPPSFARQHQLVSRFRREMQTAARLNHPNVVTVLDADEDRGVYYLAMEYIEGRDLDRVILERGTLSVEQAIDCAVQAARGLEAAHTQGIVHRDIKPGNLMLDATGTVRILDLGLARLVTPSSAFGESAPTNLTRSGVFMGTVDYMAPEQAEDSRSVDHRADIYSLGCSLYYLLTGRPPFEGQTVIKRIMAHQEQPPTSIRATRRDVPESLDAAYLAMMAKRPDDRPQSMTAVIGLLNSCRSAAGSADLSLSLDALSTSAPPTAPQSPVDLNPRIGIAGDRPGGPRFDAGPNLEQRDLLKRLDVIVPSVDAGSLAENAPTALLHKRAWQRPAGLAVLLGGSGVLAALGFLFTVLSRRSAEFRSPNVAIPNTTPPAPVARSRDEPRQLVAAPVATPLPPDSRSAPLPTKFAESEKRRTLPSASTREEAALVVPEKTPEPSPIQTKADRPAFAGITVHNIPRRTAAKVPTYDVVTVFNAHARPVRAIAITPDGRRAITASLDKTARFWEVKSGKEIQPALLHPSEVWDVAITPDGRFAFTGTKGADAHGGVRLWNLETGKKIFDRGYHVGGVRAVAFVSYDLGLSAGQDGAVILWDLNHRGQIRKLGLQYGLLWHAMTVFRDGRHALTGGNDGVVHTWNLQTGKESTMSSAEHTGPISDISISADGRRAVTGSFDHTVLLWNVDKGKVLNRFIMPDLEKVHGVAILPDGNVLGAGGAVGHLVVWDANTGAILRQAQPPLVKHNDLAVLPDGRIMTADHDALVRIWTPRVP